MHDTDKLATEGDVLETQQRIGMGVLGVDIEANHDAYGERTVRDEDGKVVGTEAVGEYGYRRSYRPRTFCDDCGANNGYAEDAPLSKGEAIRRADQLVDTLLEIGLPVNRAAMKHFVGSAKERRSLASRDKEIFENATTYARRVFLDKLK